MTTRYALASMACVLFVASCTSDAPPPAPEIPVDTTPQWVQITRERRRMDVDQIDAAIKAATGGIYWVRAGDATKTNQLTALATTLGRPDYIELTQEDTAATSIFLKFMDDMARAVCRDLIAADTAAAEPVFITPAKLDDDPGAASVDVTLSRALLRFHGHKVADPNEVAPWRNLFTGVVSLDTTANPGATAASHNAAGWNAVCIGLISSPDFYTY